MIEEYFSKHPICAISLPVTLVLMIASIWLRISANTNFILKAFMVLLQPIMIICIIAFVFSLIVNIVACLIEYKIYKDTYGD